MKTPEPTSPIPISRLSYVSAVIMAMCIGPLILTLIPTRIAQHRPITIDDKYMVCFSVFVSGVGWYRFFEERRDRHKKS